MQDLYNLFVGASDFETLINFCGIIVMATFFAIIVQPFAKIGS